MANCYDSRECCFRGAESSISFNPLECVALTDTYKNDGECPFCKASYYSKGKRSPKWDTIMEKTGTTIGARLGA